MNIIREVNVRKTDRQAGECFAGLFQEEYYYLDACVLAVTLTKESILHSFFLTNVIPEVNVR